MLKWIILALACYALYRLFANDIKKKLAKNEEEAAVEEKVAAGEMVKDPECGAYIDKDSSITVKDGDVIHRFCSYDCRDAFLEKVRNGSRVLPNTHHEEHENPTVHGDSEKSVDDAITVQQEDSAVQEKDATTVTVQEDASLLHETPAKADTGNATTPEQK